MRTSVSSPAGVIQSLGDISDAVRSNGSLLLADCAQSAAKLPLPDADFIAVSAHKLGGPPGIGALLVRDVATLLAVGGQEKGYRRGTENLPAAAGMAAALVARPYEMSAMSSLRQRLDGEIEQAGGIVIGKASKRLATIGAYAMPGVTSASQLVQFDLVGISVSAGSACSSGSMKPSRVLQAMGLADDIVQSTIRVSFGPRTGTKEVERFVAEWRRIAERARSRAA
jgi:cysteine desulfurase